MSRAVRRVSMGLLFAAFIIVSLPWLLAGIGGRLYAGGNYNKAYTVWSLTSFISTYDRDVLLYDGGNARYQSGNYSDAATQYERASHIASDKHICAINYNWAMALNAWGDQAKDADQRQALSRYGNALRALSEPRCANDQHYKQPYNQLRQEIQKKIDSLSQPPDKNQQQNKPDDTDTADDPRKILDDHSQETTQQRTYQGMQDQYDDQDSSNNPSASFEW